MWLRLLWLLTVRGVVQGQARVVETGILPAETPILQARSSTSRSVAEYPRDVLKTLYVKNGGPRGYWQAPEFCPVGTYAAGFRIKLERAMYVGGDDTSMNGVRLSCIKPGSLDFFGTISSESAFWGSWSKGYDCRRSSGQESFLTKFSLKVEPRRGNFRDDSAVNSIKFMCRPLDGSREYAVWALGGPWGTYSGWSGACGLRSAICGVQTKVATPRGPGDDTGLNDLRFFCCNDQFFHRCTPRRRGVAGVGTET